MIDTVKLPYRQQMICLVVSPGCKDWPSHIMQKTELNRKLSFESIVYI